MLVVNEYAIVSSDVNEHDVLVTGAIKIMHASPSCSCCSTACSRRTIGTSPSRRAHCASGNSPEPITKSGHRTSCAHDPVLVHSGPNPLVMLQVDVTVVVRHLLLGVSVCLQDLFFVAIISVASSSWPDLCGDHRSPASRDRWLSSPSLPCSALCALQLGYALFVLFVSSWRSFPAVGYALLRCTLLTGNGFSLCC